MSYPLSILIQQTVVYVFGAILLLIQLNYYTLQQIIQYDLISLGRRYAVVLDYLEYFSRLPFPL
jgi:hypothetical protein